MKKIVVTLGTALAVVLGGPMVSGAAAAGSARTAAEVRTAGAVPGTELLAKAHRFGWYGLGGHGAPKGEVAGPARDAENGAGSPEHGRSVPACGTTFAVSSSPNVGTSDNELHGSYAASANDAWAVGYYTASTYLGPIPKPLTEHWNGTTWTTVSNPPIPSLVPSGELLAVSGTSSTDVWAVGDYVASTGIGQALIEHWDGVRWTIVPSPSLGFAQLGNFLTGVAALSKTDVYAVGYYENSGTTYRTLIEHWNGSTWTLMTSPNATVSYNFLWSVTAVSSTNVMAVGFSYTGQPTVPVLARTLTEQWNGVSWSVVPSPNYDTELGPDDNFLLGTAVVPGTGTVWAVGMAVLDIAFGTQSTQTLVEQWNGTGWSIVPSPSFLPYQGGLFAVAVISSTDVYAVGGYLPGSGFDQTLVERWDGATWSRVTSPNVGTLQNDLLGVAATPSTGQIIGVGDYMTGTYYAPGPTKTLVEQACGV